MTQRFPSLVVCLVTTVLFLVPIVLADELTPEQQLLKTLADGDRRLTQGVTLQIRLEVPAGDFGPRELRESQQGTLTVDGQTIGLMTRSTYGSAPTFRALGDGTEALDYDADGRLIVWRRTAEDMLLEDGTFTRRSELLLHRVDAKGQVETADEPHVMVEIHDAEATEDGWLLDALLPALGRGYSGSLASVDKLTARGAQRQRVEGPGKLGNTPGMWKADVRVDRNHVVESAEFFTDGSSEPLLRIETEIDGSRDGFGRQGVIRLGWPGEDISTFELFLDGSSNRSNPGLLNDLRQRIAGSRRSSAKVYDHRLVAIGNEGDTGTFDPDPPEEGPEPPCCLCQEIRRVIYECYHLIKPYDRTCYRFDCIENIVDSAQCKPYESSVHQGCSLSTGSGPKFVQKRKRSRQKKDACPVGGEAVVWNPHTYSIRCDQCQSDQTDTYETACERQDCPGYLLYAHRRGLALNCPD